MHIVDQEVVLSIDPERRDKTLAMIRGALESSLLDPHTAAKLAGRLGWAVSTLMGRLGRAFLHPVYKVANAHVGVRPPPELTSHEIICSDGTIGPRLRNALVWLHALLTHGPPRTLKPLHLRRRVECWTDASLVNQGVGAVFSWANSTSPTFGFNTSLVGNVGAWLPDVLLQEQIIFQLELFAVLLFLAAVAPSLRGSALRVWIDNEGARFALIAGYSSNAFGARIAGQVWILCARYDISLWVERVDTKDNPSDSLSRFRYELAKNLQWRLICTKAAIRELNSLLCKPWAELGMD